MGTAHLLRRKAKKKEKKKEHDEGAYGIRPFDSAQGAAQFQLPRWVAAQLREQIISGQLKPGQFLRIEAIARASGVSMTPVREGLLLLQSEAFVRLIPRRGFMVNSFDKQDLLDLFWAQATIGAELASRAAACMSQRDIARLQATQREYEGAIAMKEETRIARLGHEFHRLINLAADSPRLALLLGGLTKQLPNRFYASIEGQLKDAADSHPIILGAIKLRNAEAAGSLMYRHIKAGGDHLVAMLERQGIWNERLADETAAGPQKQSKPHLKKHGTAPAARWAGKRRLQPASSGNGENFAGRVGRLTNPPKSARSDSNPRPAAHRTRAARSP